MTQLNRPTLTRGVCAAGALALLLAGCHRGAPPAAATAAGPKAVVVEATDAIARTVPISIDSVGHVDAIATVSIVPLINARIDAVLVADGADVKAGQSLMRFDKRTYAAQLARMQAERAARAAQVEAGLARADRSKDLISGDFLSPQQVQESQADLAGAQAALAAAEAGVASATTDLENCEPKAPFDGRVGLVKSSAAPGNFAAAGGDPLMEVRDLSKLKVEFTVPESALSLLEGMSAGGSGLKVVVSSHSDKSRSLEGPVAAFDNVVDPKSRSVRVRAVVPNTGTLFWPGQFVDVQMVVGTAENAVLVPIQSVNTGPKGAYVYVVADGKAALKPVELGENVDDLVVVRSGVTAGQKVILSGQLGLQDGSAVQVAASAGTP